MQATVLAKLFGMERQWKPACIVVLDAEPSIQTFGTDSIVNAGNKQYAPRIGTGRLPADAVCFLPEDQALVVQQTTRIRQSASEDQIKTQYFVLDIGHVAAIEFNDATPIRALGLTEPSVAVGGALKPRG